MREHFMPVSAKGKRKFRLCSDCRSVSIKTTSSILNHTEVESGNRQCRVGFIFPLK